MKPKVYTSIDINEARSPLVRVVHAEEWDLLMNELRYLRGERAAVVVYLLTRGGIAADLADDIDRGEHRREEE